MRMTVILMVLLMAGNVWADKIPPHLQKAYEEDSQNAIFIGKVAPSSAVRELNAAAAELKKARLAIRGEVAKGCRDYNGVQGRIGILEAKAKELIANADKKYKTLQKDVGKLRTDIEALRKHVKFLSIAAAMRMDAAFKALTELDSRTSILEKKAEKQWGIGIQASAAYDYNTGKDNWAQFDTIGVEGYFLSKVLLVSLSVGGGISSLNPGFAWAFGATGEYRVTPHVSLGGAITLIQDMNNMEGAVKTVPTFGPVLRYAHLGDAFTSWAITLSPIKIGPQGNKGIAGGKPSWNFDIGGALTFTWYVL